MRKSVLAVGVSPKLGELIAYILGHAGYTTTIVETPELALAFMSKQQPHAILAELDCQSDGRDPLSFIEEVRRRPVERPLPILGLSTEQDQIIKASAKAAGASGWIPKPLSPRHLISVLSVVA